VEDGGYVIVRFESLGQYAEAIDRDTRELPDVSRYQEWDGGVSPARARSLMVAGMPSLIGDFSAQLSEIETTMGAELAPQFVPDVYGTRIDVGAYLAGAPRCMRRRAKRETDTRHVNVYVSLVCSGGVNAAAMLRRGSAILGLLATLQTMRVGVDLYLVADTHGRDDGDYTQVIRVESRPLDLSTASFAIAHPGFMRGITLAYARDVGGFSGNWSKTFLTSSGSSNGRYEEYTRAISAKLGLAATDLFVPPVYFGDGLHGQTAVEWIRDRLTTCLGTKGVVDHV
jgi:hypothetical protein